MDVKMTVNAEPHVQRYYDKIIKKVGDQFDLAQAARKKGMDVSSEVESKPVTDLADRTEILVGPKGVATRFREVLKENNGKRNPATFQIFREIIEQKWCNIPDDQKRLEQAIKTALVIVTEGVVVSPLDGLPKVLISSNPDGSKYVDIYFSGPIRAAGGTAATLPLMLGDYARKLMGLDRYKPTEEEVERYVEEVSLYQTEVISRQIKLTDDEIRIIVRGCPVCINGLPTEDKEVTAYRNIPRIPTNKIRGGMALVVTEGVGLKALKLLQWAKMLSLDWSWLEGIIKVEKKADKVIELHPNPKYLEGIAAGRPLLAYPSEFGGFRIRYGKARNSAIMGKAVNPATMVVLDDFIAVGTHIKLERPGKAAQLFPCTSIDGPTVLLNNGTVKQVNTIEEAQEILPMMKKILILGDLLVTVGDFRKSNHPLVPSPFVPEWWKKILENKVKEHSEAFEKEFSAEEKENIQSMIKQKVPNQIEFEFAQKISKSLGIPLHPKFIYFYKAWTAEQLKIILSIFSNAIEGKSEKNEFQLRIQNTEESKRLFEGACVPHSVKGNEIMFDGDAAKSLQITFRGRELNDSLSLVGGNLLKSLSQISGIEILDKSGTFVGARMGRPEAATERKMKGNPHVLFPIGLYGGAIRSINKAMAVMDDRTQKQGLIEVEVSNYICPECNRLSPYYYCHTCNIRTEKAYICVSCGKINANEHCEQCNGVAKFFGARKIDLKEITERASKNMGERLPEPVKGVKGLISETKIPEPMEKGILRAKHNLHVFRDGTSRYELLNAPLTHFTPKELKLTVEKVKALGYEKDYQGNPIERDDQLIELMVQDIVVNEDCGDWMLRNAKFIDDLLVKFYKLKPYYNAKVKDDLIGELVIGLAPHTSAGIVARVIGYTKTRLGWGHPYFITCKRRNVDGDQDSVMLLMDTLLNFSHSYLAGTRGGRMDAPLVFTMALNPSEIDDEVYEMETATEYPLELYDKSQELAPPFLDSIETVSTKLGKIHQYNGFGFTHPVEQFDKGPTQSTYVRLKTMEEKIKTQARLQGKIKAVNLKDSLERVLVSHFFPDIIGNTRGFSRQTFRCTKCNSKFRRVPLRGHCSKCKGNVILTIAEGSVKKYLEIAKEMINTYELSNYLKQRIQLSEEEINQVFSAEKKKQKSLFEFA